MAFNSSPTANVIWLSHKNWDDEIDRYLANSSIEGHFYQYIHVAVAKNTRPPVIISPQANYQTIWDLWRRPRPPGASHKSHIRIGNLQGTSEAGILARLAEL